MTFLYLFEGAIVSSKDVVMSNWKENQDLAGSTRSSTNGAYQ
jgi:hypothetical protein